MTAYYEYRDAELGHHTNYLLPDVLRVLKANGVRSAFDFGCGNGSITAAIAALGIQVAGSDASEQAV